jgi:hypothetical protein
MAGDVIPTKLICALNGALECSNQCLVNTRKADGICSLYVGIGAS